MEVCAVASQDDVTFRFNPYPPYYRTAFAFSMFLYPPSINLPYGRSAMTGERETYRAYRVPPK